MHRKFTLHRLQPGAGSDQRGFILVAALTLMTILVLVGATTYLVSSTNAKVGGNFKNSQIALQYAMAGIESAREKLRVANLAGSNTAAFSDELAARVGSNGSLNDPLGTTDDLNVLTGNTNSSSWAISAGNTVSNVVYLTNDAQDSNGQYSTTDSNKKALLTSIATGPNNARAVVQAVVQLYTGVTSPATIYSKGDVTGNGSSLTISGNDECGVSTALAPVYTMSPAVTNLNGNPTLTGSPSTPQTGSQNLDVAGMVTALKGSANYTLTDDENNATYGTASSYKVVYSNTSSPANVNGLKLQNVTGYGVLLVDGDLVLGGGFTWYGPIVVTGSVTLNGGGGAGINIHGQILSGTSTLTDVTVNGSNTIQYNSCEIAKAFANQPLVVVNWKQSF